MLTLTPPETRDDEIQVDETERDSFMLKLSPTRVKAKAKQRNARGFNYIQLIVGMIIFVALSRIVGPPAFRMITRARSTALEANIQTAAEAVRNVLAIDPSKADRNNIAAGVPQPTFLAALTDDAPFNWSNAWPLDDSDDSDTIHVQFIDKGSTVTTAAQAAAGDPPDVGWLLNDWDAVRIQAKNQDGAFACALIVLKPDVDELDTNSTGASADVVDIEGTDAAANTNEVSVAIGNARLRGIWYDTADTYTAGAAGDTLHCSPVVTGGTAAAGNCEGATGGTTAACHTAGGVWVPGVNTAAMQPLPGGADRWGLRVSVG